MMVTAGGDDLAEVVGVRGGIGHHDPGRQAIPAPELDWRGAPESRSSAPP